MRKNNNKHEISVSRLENKSIICASVTGFTIGGEADPEEAF